MKFLLDANIPYSIRQIFDGDDVALHVRDLGLSDAADAAVFAYAVREKAVLITRDLDFGNILLFSPRDHYGIIVLKVPPSYHATDIMRILRAFLSRADKTTFMHATIIVEEGRFRVRR